MLGRVVLVFVVVAGLSFHLVSASVVYKMLMKTCYYNFDLNGDSSLTKAELKEAMRPVKPFAGFSHRDVSSLASRFMNLIKATSGEDEYKIDFPEFHDIMVKDFNIGG